MPNAIPAELAVSGRTIAEPRLSPDGTRVAFSTRIATSDGERAAIVWMDLLDAADGAESADGALVGGAEHEFAGTLSPIGVHPSGGGSYVWLPDSSGIVVVTKTGVELRFLDANRPGGRPNVTVHERPRLSQPTVSGDATLLAVVESRDDADALLVLDLRTAGSAPAEVRVAPFLVDPCFDVAGGSRLAWHEWAPPAMAWDHSTVYVADVVRIAKDEGGVTVHELARHDSPGVLRGQPRPFGDRLAWIDDSTGFANVTVNGTPVVAEPNEHATPTWGPGQRSFAWSPDGSLIAFVRNEEGFARLCVTADGIAAEFARSTVKEDLHGPEALAEDVGDRSPSNVRAGVRAQELGKAWHLGVSWARTSTGEERIAAIRAGGKTVPQLVVYQLRAGGAGADRSVIVRSTAGWDGLDLPEPTVVHWAAPDGTALHGRLYRPTGADATTPLPLVLSVHGGPTDQSTVAFDGRFHFLLSRGWSVLTVDHRGSTGWGRAHQQAMNGGWGDVDVADCASAVEHAVAQGWVDPARVVAMGGSAGGFVVLSLLASRPELFAGGIAVYPVTDLIDLDERTHRFEKHYSAVLVGPRPDFEQRCIERSPLHFAPRITAPLLLLHGSADDVVPVEQSIRLREAVVKAGGDVELHVYDGEGHGFRAPATRLDELHRIDTFLGRF